MITAVLILIALVIVAVPVVSAWIFIANIKARVRNLQATRQNTAAILLGSPRPDQAEHTQS